MPTPAGIARHFVEETLTAPDFLDRLDAPKVSRGYMFCNAHELFTLTSLGSEWEWTEDFEVCPMTLPGLEWIRKALGY